MLSCPFLRRLSPTLIQRDIQQLTEFIPQCPFAKRYFAKISVDYTKLSANLPTLEKAPKGESACTDVSECRLAKCPYVSSRFLVSKSDTSEENNSHSDQFVCSGISDEKCIELPVKDSHDVNIPKFCALFAGWKASRKTNLSEHKSEEPKCSEDIGFQNLTSAESRKDSGFNYNAFFASEIERKKKDFTYRVFRKILRDAEDFPFADDYSTGTKRRVAVWCSNDYLGMSWHPKVKEAAISAIKSWGVGSGGTRNISGNSVLHEALEHELADLHGKPAALVFTSCYVANEAVLHTLGTRIPNLTIFSDAGNHASMIHGIRTSRCPKYIYRHNDCNHLVSLLSKLPLDAAKLIAFETVHSMTGDVSPLQELLDITEKYRALSFVDEVHAVGLYGLHGAGVAERDHQMHRIDAITGTLGKAFASIGGYVAGTRELVDMIRSYAAGFIFTTSLPPHCLAASRASIEILKSEEGRQLRAEHQKRVATVRQRLKDSGLPVIETPSHIVPIHVGDANLCTSISEELLRNHNIYVQSINYPTVDRGDERLRIAPTPHHTDQLTEALVDALCSIWSKYDAQAHDKPSRQLICSSA